jgi:hypothetical protein
MNKLVQAIKRILVELDGNKFTCEFADCRNGLDDFCRKDINYKNHNIIIYDDLYGEEWLCNIKNIVDIATNEPAVHEYLGGVLEKLFGVPERVPSNNGASINNWQMGGLHIVHSYNSIDFYQKYQKVCT